MLQTLSIKQFAIIDELEVNFGDGLTVLSGGKGNAHDAHGNNMNDQMQIWQAQNHTWYDQDES